MLCIHALFLQLYDQVSDMLRLCKFQHARDLRDLPERAGRGTDTQVSGQRVLRERVQRDRARANR